MKDLLKKMNINIPQDKEVNYVNALTYGYMSTETDFNNLFKVKVKIEPKKTVKRKRK